MYEYKVVPVNDLLEGSANVDKLEETLNLYGELGWRLHDTLVNEIGAIPGNTQEQTLLVFERETNKSHLLDGESSED